MARSLTRRRTTSDHIGRRTFFQKAVVGAGLVVGMTEIPRWVMRLLEGGRGIRTVRCIEGERSLAPAEDIEGLFPEARAQWGRPVAPRFQWVCDYMGQCGWLDSWNPAQVQGYWTNLANQYAWLTAQHQAAMMRAMEYWAMRRYQISQPFAMPAVRSVYCSARGAESIVFGLSRVREEIVIRGRMLVLANVVLGVMSQRGDRDEAQRCGAPQSNPRPGSVALGNQREPVGQFETDHGVAAITERSFRDVNSGEMGRLAIWDSENGQQRTLVPV